MAHWETELTELVMHGDGGRQVVDLDSPQLTNVEAYVRRAILTIFLDGYRRQSNWSAAAWWGPARLLSDPVPPATPSPDAEAVGGGWAPSGWVSLGEQFHCGMEVTDLVSSSDVVRVELTGDAELVDGDEFRDHGFLEAPIRITRSEADGQSLDGLGPQLVFAQNGLVVDISAGWNEAGYILSYAGESVDAVAEAPRTPISCSLHWIQTG